MNKLRKFGFLVLAVVCALFALVGCGEPEGPTAADAAARISMAQDKQEISADFLVTNVVVLEGVTFTVTWESDNAVATIDTAKVDSKGEAKEDGKFHWVRIAFSTNTEAEQNVKLTATVANGEDKATKTITFTVPKAGGAANTIAEALASDDPTAVYTVQGTVIAENARGFIIEDATGKINAYLGSSYNKELNIGDVVVVEGKVGAYSGAAQFVEGSTYYVASKTTYSQPTPTVLDTAALVKLGADNSAKPTMQYIKFEGTLVISGSYVNINIEGTEAVVGSVAYAIDDYSKFDGQKVSVEGWFVYVTGSGKYLNIIATNVEQVGEYVEPEYKTVKTLKEALELADGERVIVTGRVKSIDTEWSEEYGNISVTITDGTADYYIFRMKTNVKVGDLIEITGVTGSYNGAKQLGAGSTAVVKGTYVEKTLAEAVALEDGTLVVVKGTVKSIDTEWSEQYGNITVTITDGTNDLYIYRMKTNVKVGDELTIYGKVGSYDGAKQIAAGSYAEVKAAEGGNDDQPTEEAPEVVAPSLDSALAVFDFGEKGEANHVDGTEIVDSAEYTSGTYTLSLTGLSKVYGPAYDATGESCLKLGTSSKVGTLSFTVGDDVKQVVIYIARYKNYDNAKVTINGSEYTLMTNSNDGDYAAIVVDTTTTKTVSLSTVAGNCRAMINTIALHGAE